MQRKIGIGKQDFAALRENQCFYIDKTDFIKQWWESQDDVTHHATKAVWKNIEYEHA